MGRYWAVRRGGQGRRPLPVLGFDFDILVADFPVAYLGNVGAALNLVLARFDTFDMTTGTGVLVDSFSAVIPEGDFNGTTSFNALAGHTYKGRITVANFEPLDTPPQLTN